MSSIRTVYTGIPATCILCGERIHFEDWDHAGYAWHHVLSKADALHQAIPEHQGLRYATERYMAGER